MIGEDAFDHIGMLTDMIDSGLTGSIVEVNTGDAKISIKVTEYEN